MAVRWKWTPARCRQKVGPWHYRSSHAYEQLTALISAAILRNCSREFWSRNKGPLHYIGLNPLSNNEMSGWRLSYPRCLQTGLMRFATLTSSSWLYRAQKMSYRLALALAEFGSLIGSDCAKRPGDPLIE